MCIFLHVYHILRKDYLCIIHVQVFRPHIKLYLVKFFMYYNECFAVKKYICYCEKNIYCTV